MSSVLYASADLDQILASPDAQELYPQQHLVFGVPLIATERTPAKSVQHAVRVFEGYLDNDHDGIADNHLVVAALINNHGAMVLANSEEDWEDKFEQLIEVIEEQDKDVDAIEANLFALFADEIAPRNGFDASLEEILHLITHIGYGNAYPEVWGLEVGTPLAKALDTARGGHFKSIPSKYPSQAWFTYDDRTCDYGCQMVEYTYWSITSYMGLQASRSNEISHEWKLASVHQFQSRDKAMMKLITDPEYKIPLLAPIQ